MYLLYPMRFNRIGAGILTFFSGVIYFETRGKGDFGIERAVGKYDLRRSLGVVMRI